MDPVEKPTGIEKSNPFKPSATLIRSPPSPLQSPIVKEQRLDNLKTMATQVATRSQLCKVCRQNLGVAAIISCHCCNESYHVHCIGYTNEFTTHFVTDKRTPFICFSCQNNGLHYKTFMERYYVDMEQRLTNKLQETVKEATSSIFSIFKTELETHKAIVNNEIQKIRDDTELKLQQMEEKISQNVPCTSNTVEKLSSLQEEINYLHAKIREKNLIISGVMEQSEINLHTIVQRVGNLYNTRINTEDIVSVQLLKTSNNPSNLQQQNKPAPPPNILIEFSTEHIRNKLFENYIAAIRAKKQHACKAIGINSSRIIYINEHLPKYILDMKNRARLIQRAGGFDAVIARPQHVSIKKGETWTKISTTEQMDSLISGIGASK